MIFWPHRSSGDNVRWLQGRLDWSDPDRATRLRDQLARVDRLGLRDAQRGRRTVGDAMRQADRQRRATGVRPRALLLLATAILGGLVYLAVG